MKPGRIILLDGASSCGKSSIARAAQARLDEPFWHWSIDHIREAGVLPLDGYRRGIFDWGADREAFFEAFHNSLPAFAGAGVSLIVEHIVETPAWMERLAGLLGGFDVFFVGIRCPLDELERREAARGDRRPGEARRDVEAAMTYPHDLELDGLQPPEDNAERLISAWRKRRSPSLFEQFAHQG